MLEVEKDKRQYLLKHIVKEEVITPLVESRFYLYLNVINANEAHHVASCDLHLIGITGIQDAHDWRLSNFVAGRFYAIWENQKILVFPAQFCNRFVRDWKQCGYVLPLERCSIRLPDIVVCQINSHLSIRFHLLLVPLH